MSAPLRIPAMVNVHSHAFQRDMRGVAERPSRPDDDFWSWRTAMFAAADRLDPDTIREVAERTYGEMRAAGYGAVGEFHYVHHRRDGSAYAEPNAMAFAVAEAAEAVGLPIVMLPAVYNRGGYGIEVAAGQRRFCDVDIDAFLARVDALRLWADGREGVSVGVAAHSIRAVPEHWLREIAAYADAHRLVRHVHAHEQPREIEECRAEYGCSPAELLRRTGFLGDRTTLVHGIHVEPEDVARIADSDTIVASCPTTEGNLGDGWIRALDYHDAGVRLAIGSDSNVVIDPFEEVRELETGSRRERLTRHGLLAEVGDLWGTLHRSGLASLGIDRSLVVDVDTAHPRLAGIAGDDLELALATCAGAEVALPPGAVAG